MSRHGYGSTGNDRRELLRAGAAVTAGAAMGPFVHTPGHAQGFNWQRFKGKEIFLIFFKNPWDDEIVKYVPEFESLTGIKVKYEILRRIQARQKLTVELTAGSGGLDAFLSSLHVEKRRFWKAGWYEPLNKYLEDKTLTAPDYDWDDFTPTAKAAVTQSDKTVSAIPSFVDPDILYYRKDIFQEKGLKLPKTLEEMEAIAQKLHNPPNLYGFVARGLKNANASPFAYIVFAMGAEYLTPDRKFGHEHGSLGQGARVLLRNAPTVRASRRREFQLVRVQRSLYAGPGAMYYDGVNFATQSRIRRNPRSRARSAIPFCPPARWPAHLHVHQRDGDQRPKPEQRAAWFFVQWASNKQNCVRELVAGVGGGRPRFGAIPTSRRNRGCRPTGIRRFWGP